MKNRYINIFIVFFFSGTIVSLIFRLIDYVLFRNSEFNLSNWSYSNSILFILALFITYSWIRKNKTKYLNSVFKSDKSFSVFKI